jgi:hypothetical protein
MVRSALDVGGEGCALPHEVIPDPPPPYNPLARTNFLVCPQVPEAPLGVPVNNSLSAYRIRLETSVPVPKHPPVQTPESKRVTLSYVGPKLLQVC